MIYSELTRRYFENAACAGAETGADWFRGEAGSRGRGTWVQFDAQVPADAGGSIRCVRFLAFGCPHVIAVCQWVAEHAVGTAAAGRLPESVQALSARFEVPVEKLGRLLIVEDAWAAALERAGAGGPRVLQRNA
jgi:NifU-like protein involved in Fe-S cluster formation